MKTLSKSKLMDGFQCPKHLWLCLHEPDAASKVDPATQFQFDEGHEVGELARVYAGHGLLIEANHWDFERAHALTSEAIKSGETLIYEASFLKDGVFARADILKRNGDGWDLIEVKKSTEVKDHYLIDVAIQANLIEACGLKLKSMFVQFINTEVRHPQLNKIFAREDITEVIRRIQSEVSHSIEFLKKIAGSSHAPEKPLGPHCDDPHPCDFKDKCWKGVSDKTVLNLPRFKKKWDLFHKGLTEITQLEARDYTGQIKKIIEVTKSNKPYIDKAAIQEELNGWEWPLYFFDFETINPAIPRYFGTTPYEKVPFQFSCHVWRDPKSLTLEHFEYLHTGADDPRPALIEAMKMGFSSKGSIVAYGKSFETSVIKKLAEFDSKNSKFLLGLVERFVDPLTLIRDALYHPDFNGSFSIKDVAPALLGSTMDYDDLEIGGGQAASSQAARMLKGEIDGVEKEKLISDLLIYCRQDTLAMVELVRWLMKNSA